jgi:hypothetical protein
MPSTVLVRMGKKASTVATTIFDSVPKPNQRMKSGTSATFGTTCVATMNGLSARSSHSALPSNVPRPTPIRQASTKPTSVS